MGIEFNWEKWLPDSRQSDEIHRQKHPEDPFDPLTQKPSNTEQIIIAFHTRHVPVSR